MSEERIARRLEEIDRTISMGGTRQNRLDFKGEKLLLKEAKELRAQKPEALRFARELAALKNPALTAKPGEANKVNTDRRKDLEDLDNPEQAMAIAAVYPEAIPVDVGRSIFDALM